MFSVGWFLEGYNKDVSQTEGDNAFQAKGSVYAKAQRYGTPSWQTRYEDFVLIQRRRVSGLNLESVGVKKRVGPRVIEEGETDD